MSLTSDPPTSIMDSLVKTINILGSLASDIQKQRIDIVTQMITYGRQQKQISGVCFDVISDYIKWNKEDMGFYNRQSAQEFLDNMTEIRDIEGIRAYTYTGKVRY